MTFTAAGVLAGTPTQSGNFPITITATDANNCVGSQTYVLVITDPALMCFTDSLAAGGPTFNRPSIQDSLASGLPAGCPLSPVGTSVFYDVHNFDVSGASCNLTATLCGPAGCGPVTGAGALANSTMYFYRTGGSLTAGTGLPNAFNPAAPCTDLVAANDNLNGTVSSGGIPLVQNTSLSGASRTVGPGRISVVVSSANNGQTGLYNLNTTISGVGCTLTPVICPSITGTISGGGSICPGGSSNITVNISGGVAPYTVTLSNGGGTQTGGPFTL